MSRRTRLVGAANLALPVADAVRLSLLQFDAEAADFDAPIRASIFAFAYNVAGIPIAAMALSSVSVISNSLRLRAVRL